MTEIIVSTDEFISMIRDAGTFALLCSPGYYVSSSGYYTRLASYSSSNAIKFDNAIGIGGSITSGSYIIPYQVIGIK